MHPFPKHPRIPTSILAALVLPLALGCATASAEPRCGSAAPSSVSTAQNSSCAPKKARTSRSPERQLCRPGRGEIVHRGYQAGYVHRNCD